MLNWWRCKYMEGDLMNKLIAAAALSLLLGSLALTGCAKKTEPTTDDTSNGAAMAPAASDAGSGPK
jgi:hypothetical protein